MYNTENSHYNSHFLHTRPGSIDFVKPEKTNEASIVILLSPVFKFAQWFGIFPLEYDANNPNEHIYVRKCSFNFIRCLVILILTTAYCIFHIFSFINSFVNQHSVIDILGQSLWLQTTVLPYFISLRLLFKPETLINLYTKDWRAVENDCGRAFSSPKLRRFARNCFIFYGFLGTLSMSTIAIHSLRVPQYPAYFLSFIKPGTNTNTTTSDDGDGLVYNFTYFELGIQATAQSFFMGWNWAGLALLDLSLCVYGFTIVETMQSILVLVTDCQHEHEQISINKMLVPTHCQDRADLVRDN